MPSHVVCRADDLPAGTRRLVTVGGLEIGVFNIDGRLHAVRNRCPHHGAPLCEGTISGTMVPSDPHEYVYGREAEIIRCPWHGYEFELETGRSMVDPCHLRVGVYPVSVEDGHVVVEV